jgi:hypothetical protein
MTVTQQLANLRQWRASPKQLSSHRVAELMCTDFAETCATSGCENNFAHSDPGKGTVRCSDTGEQSTVCCGCGSATPQISDHCLTDILRAR